MVTVVYVEVRSCALIPVFSKHTRSLILDGLQYTFRFKKRRKICFNVVQ